MQDKKNKLVVIGWMGCKQAYLNMPLEEAKKRFELSNGESVESMGVKEFDFDDEFCVYDAWEV